MGELGNTLRFYATFEKSNKYFVPTVIFHREPPLIGEYTEVYVPLPYGWEQTLGNFEGEIT
jgi:hypothetical protein